MGFTKAQRRALAEDRAAAESVDVKGATRRPWHVEPCITDDAEWSGEINAGRDGNTLIAEIPNEESGTVPPTAARKANAALIARAVNEYDVLREIEDGARFVCSRPTWAASGRRRLATSLAKLDALRSPA